MYCPKCLKTETCVIETRTSEDGEIIRRRRECEKCGFRFSTQEELQLLNITVVKKSGRKEAYNTEKMARGIQLAMSKRPMTPDGMRKLIRAIERDIQVAAKNNQIASPDIGDLVMKNLKRVDKIAYIRFASIYEEFEDLADLQERILNLAHKS
jgi:transcriptional repressor NrdR